jgi:acyl transferase domain-containing protein/NAD(P)H-dependent flavin oxidoreductase YrpB (nitropropane dioxygenase family)/NAD(P)-dependent dehydrogenase (short-subunit alcohol dehydrogenase family)
VIEMQTIIAITPPHTCDPQIAIAACRAGALGVLDLGLRSDANAVAAALNKLAYPGNMNRPWGVRWDTIGLASRLPAKLAEYWTNRVAVLVLAGVGPDELTHVRQQAESLANQVLLEVSDTRSAVTAQSAGYDGVIVKGNEAGGRVSNTSSLILLQELHEKLQIPYWIQGGIGIHTASAALLAGATGIVLCEQLWLTEEGPSSPEERTTWAQLDGSETVVVGDDDAYRLYGRFGHDKLRELKTAEAKNDDWHGMLTRMLTEADDDSLIPLGQDIAFAGSLGKRYGTVGRVVTAFRESINGNLELAKARPPFASGSPMAELHRTKYPIVQGPMGRVSDVVPFAKAVLEDGGLPFLALSVMRGPEVRGLLTKAKAELRDAPWGVGILGFLPLAMRQEQLEVIKEIIPPFAIIAGGRPGQARELENHGISTYLHVPSAELLKLFIREGARKFIFEGNEAGGHIGPRAGFVLWGMAVDALLEADIEDLEAIQVLFAGGIHDALSAAMVASIAAPLAARGIKVGVLMGSAYLFTEEAVRTGAIIPEYQNQALRCDRTVTLQSGLGHGARCAKTPYCDDFNKNKQQLLLERKNEVEVLEALERLHVGRLRVASKGVTHNPQPKAADGADKYVQVDTDAQRRGGMYMLGELATLRDDTLTIAELHNAVSTGSTALLADIPDATTIDNHRPGTGQDRDVAIVGMACRFPHAHDVRTYWENILNRVDAVREVTDDRWRSGEFFDPNRLTPDKAYSKWGGFLDDAQFDPLGYGIPPASLTSIEPMQLIALEVARLAMADAGFDRLSFPRERTAVFFGAGGMQDMGIAYIFRTMLLHYLPTVDGLSEESREHIINTLKERLPTWNEDSFPGVLGNVVAGRVANRLDLQGTNFTVDAACASSLAALDVGIDRLRSGEADVALIGAVDGTNNLPSFMAFAKSHALSPTGRCRPFDDTADGIAISEGAAAMVLKRLRDAEADGDRIYAVIKGMGSSSDGRNRSLTAPHPQGQVKAIRRAYADAGFEPSTVGLVEAHGTGTSAGDKSEIESLNLAFGDVPTARQYCAVGSVKSMIGHTKVASGLAGVIKCVLALQHNILPPTMGVEVPNSLVDLTQTPFYINTETRPWLNGHKGRLRRCGVSAFGFGGTNFHAVLEEYGGNYRSSDTLDFTPREAEIFLFSRKKRAEVQQAAKQLLEKLEHPDCINLARIANALHQEENRRQRSSGAETCRLVVVAASVADLKEKLQSAVRELKDKTALRNPKGVYYGESDRAEGNICFLFPGQGSQKVHMLRDLVVSIPELHNVFERADALLQDRLAQPLSRYIYPLPAFSDEERAHQQTELNATQVAQPALGVVDLAGLKVLKLFGFQPDFVAGHSYGEYVALCAAGVISQDDLMRLSEVRGRIVAQASKTNPGAMAAVKADEKTVLATIKRLKLSVTPANMNTQEQTVVAGSVDAVQQAVEAFNEEGLTARKIPVTAAFHTSAMASAAEALRQELQEVEFREPECKVYSNTLGDLYPDGPDVMRDLLTRHISEPVRFLEQIRKIYQDGARVFIEVGPGRVLGGLVDSILADDPHTTLHIDSPGRPGWVQLAHILAEAVILGLPADLNRWFKNRHRDDIGVDQLLKESFAEANPGPNIWRVNAGRVTPWNKPATAEPDTSKASVAFVAKAAVSVNVPATKPPEPFGGPLSQPQRDIESESAVLQHSLPQHETTPEVAAGAAPDSLVSQIQANTAQFIELQREQQQSMERFLHMQERLIEAHLSGEGTALPSSGMQPASAQPSPRTVRTHPQTPPVPPAPVLPKFVPTPSAGASGLTPAAVSTAAPTPPKTEIPKPQQTGLDTDKSKEPATTEQFQADLLHAVCERTGYPKDMLDLDAHLEADLGIDSIKRVEIFSTLREHHDLLEGRDEETLLEELAGLQTINRIVAWYNTNRNRALEGGGASSKKPLTPPSPGELETVGVAESETQPTTDPVRRYVVRPLAAPLNESAKGEDFPSEHLILLVGEAPALTAALHAALSESKYRVRQIVPGKQTKAIGNDRFEADLSSLDGVKALHGLLTRSGEKVGAVFNLMGLAPVTDNSQDNHLDHPEHLFLMLKVFEKDLKESAPAGGARLINFTAMGGQFGLSNAQTFPVGTAGTLGVAKSAAREWPGLHVKCIDVDPEMDPHILVARVWEELGTDDPLVEVGFTEEGRWKLDLTEVAGVPDLPKCELDANGVLLVTGGAYGITAEITKALADKYNPQLVLVGRSQIPEDEPESIRDLRDPQHLRQFLIQDLRAKDPKVTPADVERALKRVLKDRQIRANLAALEDMGARVQYHALDVRDVEAFGALIDQVYAKWGRIDGVLHGAGVIDDRLIRDKSPESFETVFTTKVIPATVLADKLRPELLKFVVFFSSVAARFGNVGQSDYSAANEVLNKLAGRLSREWPHVHVVSINWGPWDSGMVSDELRKLYATKDIYLVPADVGVRFGTQEVQGGNVYAPEVVIASSVKQISQWGLGNS